MSREAYFDSMADHIVQCQECSEMTFCEKGKEIIHRDLGYDYLEEDVAPLEVEDLRGIL